MLRTFVSFNQGMVASNMSQNLLLHNAINLSHGVDKDHADQSLSNFLTTHQKTLEKEYTVQGGQYRRALVYQDESYAQEDPSNQENQEDPLDPSNQENQEDPYYDDQEDPYYDAQEGQRQEGVQIYEIGQEY